MELLDHQVHEDTADRIEDELPCEDYRNDGGDVRQEHQAPYQPPQGELTVHDQGDKEPCKSSTGNLKYNIEKCRIDRFPERNIGNDMDVECPGRLLHVFPCCRRLEIGLREPVIIQFREESTAGCTTGSSNDLPFRREGAAVKATPSRRIFTLKMVILS